MADVDSPDQTGAVLAAVIPIRGRPSQRAAPVPQVTEPQNPVFESDQEFVAAVQDRLLRRLGRSALSEREAHSFLISHGLRADQARDVVAAFVDRGYLDDAAVAEQLVAKLVQRTGISRSGLNRALSNRGISREMAATAVAMLDPDTELQVAGEIAERRARQLGGLPRDVAERRLTGFLIRRGYPAAMVRTLVATALEPGNAAGFR